MTKALTQSSILEFRKTMESLFGKDMVFAFICGSSARKESKKNSDIDMFVAVNNLDRKLLEGFREWYQSFHYKSGFISDMTYPGEVVLIDNLCKALTTAKRHVPVKVIDKKQVYDGIVWAGMLAGKTIAFVGDVDAFNKLRNEAKLICRKWSQALLVDRSLGLKPEVALKNIITYQPPWKKE